MRIEVNAADSFSDLRLRYVDSWQHHPDPQNSTLIYPSGRISLDACTVSLLVVISGVFLYVPVSSAFVLLPVANAIAVRGSGLEHKIVYMQ